MNEVVLSGNLTRDPELRYTASGTAVCEFTLAVNRPKTKDGADEADFIRIKCWQRTAENVAEYCCKGTMVIVVGSIRQERWTDDSGTNQSKTGVTAMRVEFVKRTRRDQYGEQAPREEEVYVDDAEVKGDIEI